MLKLSRRNLRLTVERSRRRAARFQPNINTMGPGSVSMTDANVDSRFEKYFNPETEEDEKSAALIRVHTQGLSFFVFSIINPIFRSGYSC